MFRYILFIICIHVCFLYSFIENYEWKIGNLPNVSKSKDDGDKNVMVLFDVAEFLRKSDEPDNKLQEQRQNNLDYAELAKDIDLKNIDDYLNIDNNIPDFDVNLDLDKATAELVNNEVQTLKDNDVRESKVEETQDTAYRIRSPDSKCAFKKMKVPFFSHNLPEIKRQKRKKACYNCRKKKFSVTNIGIDRNKRSYKELCSKCREQLVKQLRMNEKPKLRVHNSRQYYQTLTTKQRVKSSNDFIDNIKVTVTPKTLRGGKKSTGTLARNIDYYINMDFNEREKRFYDYDKDRRLKELEEVEKKVDRVHFRPLNNTRFSQINAF